MPCLLGIPPAPKAVNAPIHQCARWLYKTVLRAQY